MAKKLSDIKDFVDASTDDFIEYIKRNVEVEVYDFLLKLTQVTDVYIFSGVIRNFFLQTEEIRDLDIVIRHNIDVESLLDNTISIKQNSYGGYKINISEINIDLWTLEKTWAVQYQKRLELDNEVENLHRFIPSTAFFNFSAILFSFNEEKFYYKTEFLSFIQNKEINYLYTPNANVSLCVVNSLYYADKYKLRISDKLKLYLIQLYKKKLDYYNVQIKHFGKIIFTDDHITEIISKFKIEKRQKGDYLMGDLEEIFTRLGLTRENGLFYLDEKNWQTETAFPNRVKRLIERELKPDAFFCFDNKPLILFFENPPEKHELHKAIWNFNECPIVIILESNIVEIFNGFDIDLKSKLLKTIGKDERLNDFNYFELVSGKTWEQYQEVLNYKKRVDYHLLQNIKSVRKLLVNQHKLNAKISNAIIGKAIFVRYLIDRKVKINFDGYSRIWSNEDFCQLFSDTNKIKCFFDYLESDEKGFKGDLFPLTEDEYKEITLVHYEVIRKLLNGENIEENQLSLFNFYDFSIIPIEFISNVYEMFIGQENQKKEGAYYTPLFLVDYILKETVESSLSQADRIDPDCFAICKVLDPACGSGIFLVETLRKIIEKYILDTEIEVSSEYFKTVIKNIAKENIYGIDKDLSAVQVAIFSIYLTLLDYLEPPEIETFTFPELLNTNFFEADFFDENASFNDKLSIVEFQFILGNPPWKGNGIDEIGQQYLKSRKTKEKQTNKKYEIAINNNEIAEAFVLRVSDFCISNTKISLIIRSSSLYNLGYTESSLFRKYWLEEYFIDKIFELAPVRYEVFEKSNQPAVAPAVVLFYRYANGKNTNDNIVQHIALKQSRFFSLFKIFTINRSDYKLIQQSNFKSFDWIWKVLVYGSYLDFNFIKRVKEQFIPIKEFIENNSNIIEGTGIQFSSNPSYDSTHFLGKKFIDSYGVTSFFFIPDKISPFKKIKVHRLRDERLFKSPMLLIREGIDMNTLTAKCVVSTEDVLFKDSITSIKSINGDSHVLNNIAAIFSSSLFAYYAVNVFASIGIERERVKNYNKYSLPYLNLNIDEAISSIEEAYKDIYDLNSQLLINNFRLEELSNKIASELSIINKKVFETLKIDNVESALLEYSQKINRILITGNAREKKKLFSSIPYHDEELIEYAEIFNNRFKKNLENSDRKFVVEIWHSNQIIGMFFKIIPLSNHSDDVLWVNKQNTGNGILQFLIQIGSKKITDNLFVQKDIRGFEKDSFYIFKPNERKLWHKAIAYLDANEFTDAILKEGGKIL